jgi:protein TonB
MYLADQPPPSQRLAGIAVVVVLHALIIYALVTGLGRQVVEVLRAPLETKLLEEVKPPDADVPPPPPDLTAPPPPFIPPPEIQVRQQSAANAIVALSREQPPAAPPPMIAQPALAAVRVGPTVEVGKSCRVPEYPPQSRLLGETGAVVLKFLVDVNGAVLDSQVESSSGHPRLDEAARAALSLCRFKAGTVDGRPEKSWAKLRYVWKIG